MKQIICPISLLAGQTGCLGSVCGWYSPDAKDEKCLVLAMRATVIQQQQVNDALSSSVNAVVKQLQDLEQNINADLKKQLEEQLKPLEASVGKCLEIITGDQSTQKRPGTVVDHRKGRADYDGKDSID